MAYPCIHVVVEHSWDGLGWNVWDHCGVANRNSWIFWNDVVEKRRRDRMSFGGVCCIHNHDWEKPW